ncbi:MAG: sigma 54-interacting transcriptional regulator [Deltaproteobacteria bacterium]|nr:sigma 54-interacting transcriptional regulator [Deltaproteobacteria bacterium]
MHRFNSSQQLTLAILRALEEPVSIDLLTSLTPLNSSELQEFLRKGIDAGFIAIHTDGDISLAADLPDGFSHRLDRINTKDHLSELVKKMQMLSLQDSLGDNVRVSLLVKAEREYDAVLFAVGAARKAIRSNNRTKGLDLLEIALRLCLPNVDVLQWGPVFLETVNEVLRLRFNLIRDINGIPDLIAHASRVAERLGDIRTLTRCDLVNGLYSYFMGRTKEGFQLLDSGLKQADALGDDDIMSISAEFRSVYYYLQGKYKDTVDICEAILRQSSLESGQHLETFLPEHLAWPSALGYCSALLGRYHRAVGILDTLWRRASMTRGDRNSCFFEALLGIVLIIMGRRKDAYEHLVSAREEAGNIGNAAAMHVVMKGLAYYSYFEGDLKEAYRITKDITFTETIGPQYNWPVSLEMLYTFDLKGFPPIPSFNLEKEIERVLDGPNLHLRGVSLRLRALQARNRGEDLGVTLSLLEMSEADLLITGDPIELAKTRAEMARVKIAQNEVSSARDLALMAWEGLGGYGKEFFPDDLAGMLRVNGPKKTGSASQDMIDRFMGLINDFVPSADREYLLSRLVSAVTRFFGAERGALLWFTGPRDTARPTLAAGCNLDKTEVFSESFRPMLVNIFRVFRNREPLVIRAGQQGSSSSREHGALAVICLPIVMDGESRGVLYMDNSYIDPYIEVMDRDVVVRVARHISTTVERVFRYTSIQDKERSRSLVSQDSPESTPPAGSILGKSHAMTELLSQADQAAATDATVLITGESGVGKELLARRMHDMSSRRNDPFVTVDLVTVPDTLAESELFGHEKGSFTGADRQKTGRIEMAHTGTLFFDEMGDVSLYTQVKLLRVIQEKSFTRVGGTRTIASDFRLVAATNRDLAQDVASGRFRQDLYYRLNVVSLVMPPLRQRGEDIILLAKEFLEQYARKYHRDLPELTDADISALMSYPWPGNVRELKNVMERTAILSSGNRLQLNLPSFSSEIPDQTFAGRPTIDELQRRYIDHVLSLTGGRISGPGGAAEILGMKRTTLQARMKKLGIQQG